MMSPSKLFDEATVRRVAVHPLGIDWFRVIVDLERSGLTQADIAAAIDRSQAQVAAYKSVPDTEPPFHSAMLLLALWDERCRNRQPGGPPFLR